MQFWKSLALVSALAGCALAPSGGQDTPRGYETFFSPAPHNFSFASAEAGAPVRRGARSERFELRHGDCGGSDCGNPRARAEIRQVRQRDYANARENVWYGWSFYNFSVPSYDRSDSLRLVFGQWTMGGDATPAIRLIQLGRDEGNWGNCSPAVCAGPETRVGDVVVQLEDLRRTLGWDETKNNGYVCRLFDMASNRGRWVDIVMNTNFSEGPNGYLRIWVNGEMKCDYTGPVISQRSLLEGDKVEHRRGVFASYTLRWRDKHGAAPIPTSIVHFDEFRTGKTRSDVDVTLHSRDKRRPVD